MRLVSWLLILGVGVLVLAGCAGGSAPPQIAVTVEVNGADATVKVEATGLRLGERHHLHLSLDGGPVVMTDTATYQFRNLGAGEHQVHVEVSGPDHRSIGVEQTVLFSVK